MRRLFLAFIVWLVFLSAARAANDEISITPTNLDTFFYRFSVATNATKDGVAFHITITDKRFDIYPDSGADVGVVSHKDITNQPARAAGKPLKEASFEPMNPAVPVTLKKEMRAWNADFTASPELLKTPGACFVFRVFAQDRTNGKTVPAPPADFYELKLQDFAKP